MSPAIVNGETPNSLFLSHLTSYPVASDLISSIKSNPYGKKSLSIADQSYDRLAKPVLPYLSGPYGYVSPYVHKADSLADHGLSNLDSRFPVVKKPTDEVKGSIMNIVYLPIGKANEGTTYVLDVYGSEYKKAGGQSYVTTGKAFISTGLVVTSRSLGWLSQYLSQKKEQAKEVSNEKLN
ncbi:MAG: hypothetical protein M1837_003713 [Sclerophora amabilis]|nr:MAG: hypothetical protein M1837_003713 [Sclerophora amabilis]